MSNSQSHIDVLIAQTELSVEQCKAQVDIGLLLQEFYRNRQQVSLAEGNRCSYMQSPRTA